MSIFWDPELDISEKDLKKAREEIEQITSNDIHKYAHHYREALEKLLSHEEIKRWYQQVEANERKRHPIVIGDQYAEAMIMTFIAPYLRIRVPNQNVITGKFPMNHPFARPDTQSYLMAQYLAMRFQNPAINKAFKQYHIRFNARWRTIEEYARLSNGRQKRGEETIMAEEATVKAGFLNMRDVTEIIELIRREYEKDPRVFQKEDRPPIHLRKRKGQQPKPEPAADGFFPIPASAANHMIQRALAMGNQWAIEAGEMWPSFSLTNRKKTVKGLAFMRPTDTEIDPEFLFGPELAQWQAKMLEYARKHLDDMAVDVYDAIMAEWMDKAQYPEQMVTITLDKIMEYRSLKPKTDEKGHRRGHQQKHKEAIARRIMALSGVFVKFDEVEVTEVDSKGKKRRVKWSGRGPLVQIDVEYTKKTEDGRQEVMGYHCRPGLPIALGLHGPGRQAARLARIALQMDPYREKYEKRLLRYFAYLWRVRQASGDYNKGVKVGTILEEIGLEVEKKNPARTKERLENALDRLKERGAIAGWEYEGRADEAIVGTRGWADKWLDWRVAVEPPDFIMDHYREKINSPEPQQPALPQADMRQAIREARKNRGLTITQAAEEIGISKSMLSMIENGRAPIGPRVWPKIEKWLNQ